MLLTCVAVVARERQPLAACPKLGLMVERFVDGPERWLRLSPRSKFPGEVGRRPSDRREIQLDKDEVLAMASRRGLLHVLQWLYAWFSRRNIGTSYVSPTVWRKAAEFGHLHVLEWLHSLPGDSGCTHDIVTTAMALGRADMVRWMLERYPTSWCNSFHLCRILRQDLELRRETMSHSSVFPRIQAARAEVVKTIHEHHPNFAWSPYIMDSAAAGGYLDIVKFLHERSEGCTVIAMNAAARYGHLDIVKYLHEKRTEGCTVSTMDGAAARGYLEIVRFLHENRSEGCSPAAIDDAVGFGHLRVAEWLAQNRPEKGSSRMFDVLVGRLDYDTLRCVLDNWSSLQDGISRAIQAALRLHNTAVIWWLYQHYPSEFDAEIVESWLDHAPQTLEGWLSGLRCPEPSDA